MSTLSKVAIGIFALFIISFVSCAGYVVSTNNQCVEYEKRIEAQYKKNQNVYDAFWKTVKEVAQVPEMYAEDTKKLYKEVLAGRYGEGGSRAMWQWLKEQNPNLDASLYKSIQQAIEAGRTDFKLNQTVLLDMKAQYEMYKGKFPRSFITNILGFPKIDLKQFDIVTSAETEKAFINKKADFIKIK